MGALDFGKWCWRRSGEVGRRFRIAGNTALINATAPKTLTSNWWISSPMGDSSNVPSWP
jgi:hypothetical protein